MVGLNLERDGDSYRAIEQSETPLGKEISLMNGNLLKPLIYFMMIVPLQYLLCDYISVYKQKTFGC